MDFSTQITLSILTGSFGMAYFIYGKKQTKNVPLFTGIALMVYPYFVDNTYLFIGLGVVLIVLPYFIRD